MRCRCYSIRHVAPAIAVSWNQVYKDLDAEGNAIINGMLSLDECDRIRALYEKEEFFRSRS